MVDIHELKTRFYSSDVRERLLDAYWPWVRDHFIHQRYTYPDILKETSRIAREVNEGRPIQYVLGWAPFMNHILKVNSDVLIPRSETEELVHHIQQYYPKSFSGCFVDIGTGSGAIAIAIAAYFNHARVIAVDISANAIKLAKENAERCHVKIEFIQDDFLEQDSTLYNTADVIISNPPYISQSEQGAMDDTVIGYEPGLALYGPEEDPLLFYRLIADQFKKTKDIWLEMNALQYDLIEAMFNNKGKKAKTYKDLQGQPRVLFSER